MPSMADAAKWLLLSISVSVATIVSQWYAKHALKYQSLIRILKFNGYPQGGTKILDTHDNLF